MRLPFIVFLLTSVNLLNYVDRGLIAGAGTLIKGCVPTKHDCGHVGFTPSQESCDRTLDETCSSRCMVCNATCVSSNKTVTQTGFGINDFSLGVIQSTFMAGYMSGSFAFSTLSSRGFRVYPLLAAGMAIWTLAALISGVSGFLGSPAVLVFGRILSGVGEAALATVALPHLDDVLPSALKGRVFALYYCAMPVGTALGFVFAGEVSEFLSWRWTFLIEAMCMPPFVAAFLCVPSLQAYRVLRVRAPTESGADDLLLVTEPEEEVPQGVWHEIQLCLESPTYLHVVLGLAMFTFTTAGLAFYMPIYLQTAHLCDAAWAFTEAEADAYFGAMVIASGLVGTLLGGFALDWSEHPGSDPARALRTALKFGFLLLLAATGLLVVAIGVNQVRVFFALAGLGMVLIFSTTVPSMRATLMAIPLEARPAAMALTNAVVHLFGDVPSPIVIGAVSDAYSPTKALLTAWVPLLAACLFWFLAWTTASGKV